SDKYTSGLFFNKIYPLIFFMIYAFFITIAWFLILVDFKIFLPFLFLIFNFLLLYTFAIYLVKNNSFYKKFPLYIFICILIQFFISILIPSSGSRSSLFFNNPNQLGYFTLCAASIIVFYYKTNLLGKKYFTLSMIFCLWLSFLSLSSASMISIIFLIIYAFFSDLRSFLSLILLVLILTFLIFLNSDIGFVNDKIFTVQEKLSGTGQASDDSLAGRGYDRIFNHPEIVLIGGGEGFVSRWKSLLSESEMHSTWGTLLFSYGIFGFFSFLWFLRKIIFSEKMVSFIPFLAIALYGLTHNGLRFTFFWIFLAVLTAHSLRKSYVDKY
ncbi:MAG: hypothetical protein ACRC4N_17955, partial [Gammaproteobacteria bacterium]